MSTIVKTKSVSRPTEIPIAVPRTRKYTDRPINKAARATSRKMFVLTLADILERADLVADYGATAKRTYDRLRKAVVLNPWLAEEKVCTVKDAVRLLLDGNVDLSRVTIKVPRHLQAKYGQAVRPALAALVAPPAPAAASTQLTNPTPSLPAKVLATVVPAPVVAQTPKVLRKVVAVANWGGVSGHSNHLRIRVGDKITVVQEYPDGWSYGTSNGHSGYYPTTFAVDPVANFDAYTQRLKAVGILVARTEQPLNISELLVFPAGALLKSVEDIGCGWMRGAYNGKVGCFPAALVK